MRTGPGSPLRAVALRLGVLAALVVAAVGLRGGSPFDADHRPWRIADLLRGTATGLQVLALLWVLLIVVVLALRRGGGGQLPARPPRRSPLLVLLVLLLLFGAARLLSQAHLGGSGHPGPTATPAPAATAAAHSATHRAASTAGLSLLVVVVLIAVLTAVVATRRNRPALPPAEPEAEQEAVSDGLAQAARVLRDRTDAQPRERVLLAYVAFEQALAARGLQRGVAGTPTALLERAVAGGAPAVPAQQLTRLFGAARFGADPVTERDVDAAERALHELMASR